MDLKKSGEAKGSDFPMGGSDTILDTTPVEDELEDLGTLVSLGDLEAIGK